MSKIIRKSVEDDYKRANNDTWICNQLEDLVIKYEEYLRPCVGKDVSTFEIGKYYTLRSVIQDLKELLYNHD